MSIDEVAKAIRPFLVGSAGGPDGLRPQYLKDLISPSSEGGGHALLSALASFLSLVLSGRTPLTIRPYFFGANLCALEKKDVGVRPITVGCTLRRFAPKIASGKVLEDMGALLAPRQLGFGVKGGVEAAAHSARLYLRNLKPEQVLMKLYVRNAFNSLRRDKMLSAVQVLAPTILPFVHSAYSNTSFLFWDDKSIQSCEGIQQGDPLGPLLFCLTLYQLQSCLGSEFCLLYLNDVTLSGDREEVLHDFNIFEQEAADLGLRLNQHKSEVICEARDTEKYFLSFIPGSSVIASSDACLLGSPIGDIESISSSIAEKIRLLGVMGERLQHLDARIAIFLLRHSFSIPMLLYTLRTSPCFLSSNLALYDDKLRSIVGAITNIVFELNTHPWIQASLSVKYGGLGFRSAVQLVPSALLASAAASSNLAHHILPSHLQSVSLLHCEEAVVLWSQGLKQSPPEGSASYRQKSWDAHKVLASAESLLEGAPDATSRARLLAVSTKETGGWLNAYQFPLLVSVLITTP